MGKAQTLLISFILLIGIVIIVIPLVIDQLSVSDQKKFEEFDREAKNLGNLLVEPPSPPQAPPQFWERAGLLDGDKITEDSLLDFASIPYQRSKLLLGMQFDYIFFLQKDGIAIPLEGEFTWEYLGWNGGGAPNGGSNYNEILLLIQEESQFVAKEEKFVMLDIDGQLTPVELIIYVFDDSGIGELQGWIPDFYDFTGEIFTNKLQYSLDEQVNLTGDIWQ